MKPQIKNIAPELSEEQVEKIFQLFKSEYASHIGSITSKKKAAASRANGKKGGRPRKKKPQVIKE